MAINWTLLRAQGSPQNGGTVASTAWAGTAADFASLVLPTVTATPKAICNWSFDSFSVEFTSLDYGTVRQYNTVANPHQLNKNNLPLGENYSIVVTALFRYNGTGKLMRSSLQPGKLIRVGDKLLRDQ